MIQRCLWLYLLKHACNFKVGVEVSRIEFDDAFEMFVGLLLVALLTRFYLSQYADRFIAILEFILA